jgi:hypothetical protein
MGTLPGQAGLIDTSVVLAKGSIRPSNLGERNI